MDFVKARLNENQKVLIKKLKGNMKTILWQMALWKEILGNGLMSNLKFMNSKWKGLLNGKMGQNMKVNCSKLLLKCTKEMELVKWRFKMDQF